MNRRVFIANFGRENYIWPRCLQRSTVATFESLDLWPFSQAGDRDGFIARCIATKKTAAGITPTVPVASRWFNLVPIVQSTADDIWIHREKTDLWWTTSHKGPASVELADGFEGPSVQVYEIHKPADPWSDKGRRGAPLRWDAIHPKARTFLFTEGTLQELAEENAAYAVDLIEGRDLAGWHGRPEWRRREDAAKRGAVTFFDARRRSAVRMVQTALQTVRDSAAPGQVRTPKRKEARFASDKAFQDYVAQLIESQEGCCAVTGIQLQYDGDDDDVELLCSLDRIDSDGHYEAGNLQVVCRFVNRWKNDGDDGTFRRLIALVRR